LQIIIRDNGCLTLDNFSILQRTITVPMADGMQRERCLPTAVGIDLPERSR
jgi:hypothetical protein